MTARARSLLVGVVTAGSLLVGTGVPVTAYVAAAAPKPAHQKPQAAEQRALKAQAPNKPGSKNQARKQAPKQQAPKRQAPKKQAPKRSGPKNSGPRKPAPKPDRTAPAAPSLGGAWTGAGGAVFLPVSAEPGSRVEVRAVGGSVVASGTGTGATLTFSWSTSTGTRTYVVAATDQAGNRSRASTVTVTADATPPSLASGQIAAGNRLDSRSRLTFSTEPGASYRIFVDGRIVRQRSDLDGRVAAFLDVGNGRHQARVEARDGVGNLASWFPRPFHVNIRRLAVRTTMISDTTDRIQRLRVEATPNATRGVVRIPGEGRRPLRFSQGRATVRLRVPDGIHDGVTVTVRDGWGRVGTRTLRRLVVDTTAPEVEIRPDRSAAAEGLLRATITTEPAGTVEWRLLDGAGAVVTSGELVADSGEATIDRDVQEGSYRLEVGVSDEFDRTTTEVTATRVASDPWPTALLVLVLLAGLGAAVALVVLLARLLPRLRRRVHRAGSRVTAVLAKRDVARSRAAELPEQEWTTTAPSEVTMPRQRSRHHAVATVLEVADDGDPHGWFFVGALSLLPDERVLHTTTGRLAEAFSHEVRDVEPDGHDGQIVVTSRRIAFAGDVTREWRIGNIAAMRHVGEDGTMLLRWREDGWSRLVYDDYDVTRLHLDLSMAEQQGKRRAYLADLEEELRRTVGLHRPDESAVR